MKSLKSFRDNMRFQLETQEMIRTPCVRNSPCHLRNVLHYFCCQDLLFLSVSINVFGSAHCLMHRGYWRFTSGSGLRMTTSMFLYSHLNSNYIKLYFYLCHKWWERGRCFYFLSFIKHIYKIKLLALNLFNIHYTFQNFGAARFFYVFERLIPRLHIYDKVKIVIY